MSSRGSCARNAVIYRTKDAAECRIPRKMLCFTKEMAVGGRGGRRCQTAVAVMFAYGRIGPPLGSVIASRQTHCNGGLKVVLGCRWLCSAIGKCICRFRWWHCVMGE